MLFIIMVCLTVGLVNHGRIPIQSIRDVDLQKVADFSKCPCMAMPESDLALFSHTSFSTYLYLDFSFSF
jgi:hypothetical protein